VQAIDANEYVQARRAAQQIDITALDRFQQRQLALLLSTLDVVTAGSDREKLIAWRRYAALLLACVWEGYGLLQKESGWRPFQRPPYAEERQIVQEAYWWLQIVLAREAGELPAWEAIRLVRERRE
jgi:hypothetical protein